MTGSKVSYRLLPLILLKLIMVSNLSILISSITHSVAFELQHNVCGRRVYAEGTVDAVEFLAHVQKTSPPKRVYNMIDVLESGRMK